MFSKPRALVVLTAIGVLSLSLLGGRAIANSAHVAKSSDALPIQWDEKAAEEAAHALHRMHDLVNEGNFEAAKDMIVGDDVLFTFELGTDNVTPVTLRSKAELFKYMEELISSADNNDGVTIFLDKPKHRARATSNLAIITEECTVRFRNADGLERVDKLVGTNVAVKYPDGWKFIQWHMSVAGPSKFYKNGKLVSRSQ